MAVASTMLPTVLPSAATMPMASTNSGKAMMVSDSRVTAASHQPPKKPAASPKGSPTTKDRPTAATAMPRSSRVATTVREKMSRPTASVPNQCAAEGGCSAAPALVAKGS